MKSLLRAVRGCTGSLAAGTVRRLRYATAAVRPAAGVRAAALPPAPPAPPDPECVREMQAFDDLCRIDPRFKPLLQQLGIAPSLIIGAMKQLEWDYGSRYEAVRVIHADLVDRARKEPVLVRRKVDTPR